MGNQLLGPPADGVQVGEGMTNEEIIELAREVGFKVDWQHADVAEIKAQRYVAFAHAVIKQHEAKLIEGVGEPFMVLEEDIGWEFPEGTDSEWLTTLPIGTKTYLESQVAAAIAKERADYQASMDHQNAMARQRKDRIATLEAALKVALECIEGVVRGDYDGNGQDVSDQIKEVLHD